MENPIAGSGSLQGVRVAVPLTLVARKVRTDVPGKGLERGCTEVGLLLSGSHFPAHNAQC